MTHDTTAQMIASRADVTTDAAARYAMQLVAHLGRKLEFTTNGDTSTASVGDATAQVIVGDGVLSLLVAGDDEEAVSRVQHVLGSHLERFGQRTQLTVAWTRATHVPARRRPDRSRTGTTRR